MALWLVRAGAHGEFEQKFLNSGRIYLTWEGLENENLSQAKDWLGVKAIVKKTYPDRTERIAGNWAGQIWAFAVAMKLGDWAVLPLKLKPAIAVAEITSTYQYDPHGEPLFRHFRDVRWLGQDVPRSAFDQDLLYSFGSALTICQIQRNEAEKRVKALGTSGWKQPKPAPEDSGKLAEGRVDLEQLGRDQIAKLIAQQLKGHGLARLVEAILRAQGYTTYRSPEGPDKGVDILASPGPLGFGNPRICVQVKSGDAPVDTPTLNQLIGSMQNVQADQGLLVSWGGFKSSVDKEVPVQFFRVRLWDQAALIRELLATYDKLDEDLRAELPLKRIWSVALQEEED
ncbi:MAG: restriction endonuclease [Planctomycetes bacterium]|nr:restriction endonuclease [Planctomycetota bacterium]